MFARPTEVRCPPDIIEYKRTFQESLVLIAAQAGLECQRRGRQRPAGRLHPAPIPVANHPRGTIVGAHPLQSVGWVHDSLKRILGTGKGMGKKTKFAKGLRRCKPASSDYVPHH